MALWLRQNSCLVWEAKREGEPNGHINDLFSHRQLTSLVPLMAQATEHLQSQWQDGEVIDLAQQMMQLTLVISLGRERLKSDLNSERMIGTGAERKSR